MKIILTVAGLLNGIYMLLDGIYVLLKGKYIGSEKPGPWAALFYKLNIDVFKLGPLFIVFGIMWLLFLVGLWTGQSWTFAAGISLCILTLWYIPVGTALSVIVFILLLNFRQRLGI